MAHGARIVFGLAVLGVRRGMGRQAELVRGAGHGDLPFGDRRIPHSLVTVAGIGYLEIVQFDQVSLAAH
jgi:hypothetical protein